MKKVFAVIVSAVVLLAAAAYAAGRYDIAGKSATTVVSTSNGGNIGLFTKVSGSSSVKFDAYTLRIRQAQYRGLDLLVSEVGSGPGAKYDTCYAGQTWESPVRLRHNDGIHVNLTCTVSDLVVEATFYQRMEP